MIKEEAYREAYKLKNELYQKNQQNIWRRVNNEK